MKLIWRATLLLGIIVCPVMQADEASSLPAALAPLIKHVGAHRDGSVAWSIDFSKLDGDRSSLPVGIFDSGIGGLTVLEAILKIDAFNNSTLQPGADGVPDFAGEKFIYFGDQANMPYGNYPSQGREGYLRELILKDVTMLLGKRWRGDAQLPVRFDKPPVKAIVIACNTATAYGLDDIRAALKSWGLDVPVIGIIEAGARAVVDQLPASGKAQSVGVLATVGTCSCNAYPKAIAHAAGLAGKPVPFIAQQGSIGLAGAIERNPAFIWNGPGARPVPYAGPGKGSPLNTVPDYIRHDLMTLFSENDKLLKPAPLKFLVLGCTHFPLAEKEISAELEDAMLSGVRLINPAEYTAKELFRELARRRIRALEAKVGHDAPVAQFYFSVPNPSSPGVKLAADGSLDADYKSSRMPGHVEVEDTVAVPLTRDSLPAGVRPLVQSLPAVWAQFARPR